MPKKKITDGNELFKKKTKEDQEKVEEPTQEEFAEAMSPYLSDDKFSIGDKTFSIKVSNIKTSKQIVKCLGSINTLISKIDIISLVKKFIVNMSERRKLFAEQVLKKPEQEEIQDTISDFFEGDMSTYIDIADLIRHTIVEVGLDNAIGSIIDLYTKAVFAICNSQDEKITLDWVENNLSFENAQKIFFAQMEKDNIQGRIINFLARSTRLITGTESNTQNI